MNWYKMQKIAFPYARIQCPYGCKNALNLKNVYLADLGYKDVANTGGNQKGNTSTMEKGENPFVEQYKHTYDEPIDGTSSDEVEDGTVLAQCPKCKGWAVVGYHVDSAQIGKDGPGFADIDPNDVSKISPEMAKAYMSTGVPTTFTTEDYEPPKYKDVLKDPMNERSQWM